MATNENKPRRGSEDREVSPTRDRQTERESDATARGYDEAVRSGASRYGVPEGRGGVFGTSGGGSYDGGFQIIERAGLYDRSGAPGPFEPGTSRGWSGRDSSHFDAVNFDRGPHSGKGPKNYRRRDERILEDVGEALMRHGEIDASNIEVEVNEGIVTLRGTVDTRRTKRLVEDVVEMVAGVSDVQNELKAEYLLRR